MAHYHAHILLIFLTGSILYALWVTVFLKQRRRLDFKHFKQAADNQNIIVQLISGMQEIKLNNCEKQKRWEWERIQAKLYRISIKSMTLGQTQIIGGLFIDQTKNVIVSFLAAKAVIDGDIQGFSRNLTSEKLELPKLSKLSGLCFSNIRKFDDFSIFGQFIQDGQITEDNWSVTGCKYNPTWQDMKEGRYKPAE